MMPSTAKLKLEPLEIMFGKKGYNGLNVLEFDLSNVGDEFFFPFRVVLPQDSYIIRWDENTPDFIRERALKILFNYLEKAAIGECAAGLKNPTPAEMRMTEKKLIDIFAQHGCQLISDEGVDGLSTSEEMIVFKKTG